MNDTTTAANQSILKAIQSIDTVIAGKSDQLKKALACVLSGGHILFEDLPGTGKTSIAQALASVLALDFSRVQFTSDLLPSDVLGTVIFEQDTNNFRFQKGPVFTQLLLADEINRTTPKTQSALLEAMAEEQVTIDGTTYALPKPFFVVATQNPQTQFGTFALPESQLDRFMLSLSIGYPDHDSEKSLLLGQSGRDKLSGLQQAFSAEQLLALRKHIKQQHVSEPLVEYILRLVEASRNHPQLNYGISPRGALALVSVAKSWAFIHQRNYVIPEDIQELLVNAWQHRLVHAASSSVEAKVIIQQLLETTPVNI